MSHYSQQTFFWWNCERDDMEDKCCQMLLYRNHRLIRDRSPVWPPCRSHSSWALIRGQTCFPEHINTILNWLYVCFHTAVQFCWRWHLRALESPYTLCLSKVFPACKCGRTVAQATVSPNSGWTPGFLAEDCKQTSRHQRLSGQQSVEEKGCLICVSAVCVRWPVSMSGSSGATSTLPIS